VQRVHVPLQVKCGDDVILVMPLGPKIAVDAHQHLTRFSLRLFATRRVVLFELRINVVIDLTRPCSLEHVDLGIQNIRHDVNVNQFLVAGAHFPTKDTNVYLLRQVGHADQMHPICEVRLVLITC